MANWEEAKKRAWFITEVEIAEGQPVGRPKKQLAVRYAHTLIRYDEEYGAFLGVTMENNLNSPDQRNTKVEWIDESSMFESKRDAEMEILLRERFYNR